MSDRHDAPPEPAHEPELFVEFANDVRLAPPDAPDPEREVSVLRAWLVERDLVSAAPAQSRLEADLPAFRDLRGLVRAVATRATAGQAPTRRQVEAINRVMRQGLHYHALRPDGKAFSMRPVGDELSQARASIAGSLAHYLSDHDRSRLRVCADDTCRWVFVDRSPAGRRRWCEMRTCGNRAKVARHRARARATVRP